MTAVALLLAHPCPDDPRFLFLCVRSVQTNTRLTIPNRGLLNMRVDMPATAMSTPPPRPLTHSLIHPRSSVRHNNAAHCEAKQNSTRTEKGGRKHPRSAHVGCALFPSLFLLSFYFSFFLFPLPLANILPPPSPPPPPQTSTSASFTPPLAVVSSPLARATHFYLSSTIHIHISIPSNKQQLDNITQRTIEAVATSKLLINLRNTHPYITNTHTQS